MWWWCGSGGGVVMVWQMVVMVVGVMVVMLMGILMIEDRLGHWLWSIIHCLHVFCLIKSWQVGCKQVVMVVKV